jgi:hypothetical protein
VTPNWSQIDQFALFEYSRAPDDIVITTPSRGQRPCLGSADVELTAEQGTAEVIGLPNFLSLGSDENDVGEGVE